jgi:hypothetical protein
MAFIHNFFVFVQPDNAQIHFHKEHMNAGRDHAFTIFYDHNSLVVTEGFPEHKSSKFLEKAGTNFQS